MRLPRILAIWAILAGLMFFNGALRVVIFSPFLGREAGEMMSLFIALIIIFGATRPFLIEVPAQPARHIWLVSLTWVGLTFALELVLGLLFGRTWSEIGRTYMVWDGSFWPVILLAVGVAPFQWIKRVDRSAPRGTPT